MANQQQNITVAAPGFFGLNTHLSPTQQPQSFASVADHCIIDREGRIASRNGLQLKTTNGALLGSNPEDDVSQVAEFFGDDGESVVFCVGNSKILKHDMSTYEMSDMTITTPPTGDDWQIIPFNNKCYFVQDGHRPVYYDHSVGGVTLTDVADPSAGPASLPTLTQASCGVAAFGRLWLAGFSSNKSLIAWSALLDGTDFELASGAGTLDLSDAWPTGNDSVRALAVHNDYLVIFGYRSILVYDVPSGGASVSNVGPAYMTLEDTVAGFGCVARDSVQSVGTDLLFLDASGLRSFQRTVQEKSMPMGDISWPIQEDIRDTIIDQGAQACGCVRAFYDVDDATYYLIFTGSDEIYVFDFTMPAEGLPARITRWPDTGMTSGMRLSTGANFFGGPGGLYELTGNVDKISSGGGDGSTSDAVILWKYYTHPLNFGEASREKFLKQIDTIFVGDTTQLIELHWSFDFLTASPNERDKNVLFASLEEYGTDEGAAEYGISEYSGSQQVRKLVHWNVWGSGRNVRIGWESSINGATLALQELNVQATIGRIV